ncbi:MAG TPA: glutathione S-transferase family protein [Woeseiaceae bacterium]|jgi:glutathione S-transferase|nr:glutathione S-transferase family protein [Woeseiaceae bacterium]
MNDANANIRLFELGPTRSSRARWTLLEAGLDYESIGNSVEIFQSEELRKVHPLGKLPAAIIGGRPLFESAAIVTAIADLVPDKNLVAKPGSWSRYLHYQWVSYALSEMEAFLQSIEVNRLEFLLPKAQQVPAIIEQNEMLFRKGASALDEFLGAADFLVDNRFSVTDIFVGYTVSWGEEDGLLGDFPKLRSYLDRLCEREHCTLQRH